MPRSMCAAVRLGAALVTWSSSAIPSRYCSCSSIFTARSKSARTSPPTRTFSVMVKPPGSRTVVCTGAPPGVLQARASAATSVISVSRRIARLLCAGGAFERDFHVRRGSGGRRRRGLLDLGGGGRSGGRLRSTLRGCLGGRVRHGLHGRRGRLGGRRLGGRFQCRDTARDRRLVGVAVDRSEQTAARLEL